MVGVAERAAGDVDESVGRRQREDDDQELSRPWSELSAKAEAQLKESFVAFREAVEQAREAVDSAESMISAAERADSGALSQRPAQGVRLVTSRMSSPVRPCQRGRRTRLRSCRGSWIR